MNISHGGMCVQTGEMLPQEAHVQLSFSIPGHDMIAQATGTVIWAHISGRAGIKLVGLSPEAQPHFGQAARFNVAKLRRLAPTARTTDSI